MRVFRTGRALVFAGLFLLITGLACGQDRAVPTAEQQRLAEDALSLSGVLVDGLDVEKDVAYVGWHCDGSAPRRCGLHAIDVKNPAAPCLLKSLAPGRAPAALTVKEGLLYVAWCPEETWGGGKGAEIYDVKNPGAPDCLSSFPDAKEVENIAVSGEYAFLARRHALLVYDIQNPSKPFLAGQLPVEGWIHGIKVRSNLVYLASNGLKIVDVSAPSSPKLVGKYDSHGESWGVSLIKDKAYVPIEYFRWYLGRASIFDISNPATPKVLDRFATGKGTWHVETSGEVIYVAGNDELKCYDAAKNCRHLGSYKPRDIVGRIQVAGNRLYVADRYGFQILDIAEPGAPRFLGQYDIISERERNDAMEKVKAAFPK